MSLTSHLSRALFGALFGALLVPALAFAAPTLDDVEQHIVSVAQWGGTPANPALARKQEITHITLQNQPSRP